MNVNIDSVVDDFSIARGSILFLFLNKIGLNATSFKGTVIRSLSAVGITWLPLLILSLLQGLAFGHTVALPFVKDFAIHTRFLVVIPMLIFAANSFNFYLIALTAQFFKSGILNEDDLTAYLEIKKRVKRLSESLWPNLFILLLCIATSFFLKKQATTTHFGDWMLLPGANAPALSWAGNYLIFVSLPVFQFIIYRWLWQWIIWFIYFLKLSRMPLKLNAAHPDLAGGLGFLGFPPGPFLYVTLALSISFSTIIVKHILFLHTRLQDYYHILIAFVLFALITNVLPLLVFMKVLYLKRRQGFFEYETLIQEHHRLFDEKWLRKPKTEPSPGIGDASSLTDFNTTFDVVRKMRIIPFDLKIMFSTIIIAILPMLPLLALEFNLVDVMKKMFDILIR